VICTECGVKPAEAGRSTCFRCRVAGVGFNFKGSAQPGRTGWNRTANEWRLENFGTSDERELAKRGIERADD
jgi:hypothetical protein